MWAKDFRLGSTWFHFWALPPNANMLLSTGRLCHITSAGSGTSPIILRLNRFTMNPNIPLISALGIRVVLDMFAPRVDWIDMKTPPAGGM